MRAINAFYKQFEIDATKELQSELAARKIGFIRRGRPVGKDPEIEKQTRIALERRNQRASYAEIAKEQYPKDNGKESTIRKRVSRARKPTHQNNFFVT